MVKQTFLSRPNKLSFSMVETTPIRRKTSQSAVALTPTSEKQSTIFKAPLLKNQAVLNCISPLFFALCNGKKCWSHILICLTQLIYTGYLVNQEVFPHPKNFQYSKRLPLPLLTYPIFGKILKRILYIVS